MIWIMRKRLKFFFQKPKGKQIFAEADCELFCKNCVEKRASSLDAPTRLLYKQIGEPEQLEVRSRPKRIIRTRVFLRLTATAGFIALQNGLETR